MAPPLVCPAITDVVIGVCTTAPSSAGMLGISTLSRRALGALPTRRPALGSGTTLAGVSRGTPWACSTPPSRAPVTLSIGPCTSRVATPVRHASGVRSRGIGTPLATGIGPQGPTPPALTGPSCACFTSRCSAPNGSPRAARPSTSCGGISGVGCFTPLPISVTCGGRPRPTPRAALTRPLSGATSTGKVVPGATASVPLLLTAKAAATSTIV